ncbi:MAG: tetratricopeptide repeat protein [Verrucomicrobiota bacterium]|nr:tetratricopeptide repeat protein [Verrucomicrobiota bacterium]
MMAAALLPAVAIGEPSAAKGVTVSKEGTKIEEDGHAVEFGQNGVTKIDTQNPDFDRGMEALFADRMREALDYLGRSLRTDPTNPQAHLNRAEAFDHLEQYPDAIAECDQAIALSKAGWIYRAKHSENVGKTADALVARDLASAYARRGIAKWNLQRKTEAVADFDEAVRLKTKNATVYIYRGQSFLNQGKFDLALQDFDAAIALDNKSAYGYGLRALVRVHEGSDALAAADLFRAGQIDEKVRAECAGYAQRMRAARAAK